MSKPAKRNKFLWVRMAVGLTVMAILLAQVNLSNLVESARQCSKSLLMISFFIMAARLLIGARRWRLACTEPVDGISFWRYYAWYMEAAFFNIFAPSQGGDLARVIRLSARKGDGAFATSTVVAERMLGLVSMLLLAGSGLLFSAQGSLIPRIGISFSLIAMATAVAMTVLFHPACSRVVTRFFIGKGWNRPAKFVERCAGVFNDLGRRPMHLAGIVGYSLAMQLTAIVAIYFIGLAISVKIPLAYYLTVVPIVWLVVMIPVSLNGIGTREAAAIALLATVGVPAEAALLLSVIWSGQLLLIGLIGGFFHLWLTATETKYSKSREAS